MQRVIDILTQSTPPSIKRRFCFMITDSPVGSPVIIILKAADDSLLSPDHMPEYTGLGGLHEKKNQLY